MSHGDSAISHPRDQDYLSLKVGKGSEVELQQATSIWWLQRKREREEKAKHGRETRSDQEETTYVRHNSNNRVHFPDPAEKRPSRLPRPHVKPRSNPRMFNTRSRRNVKGDAGRHRSAGLQNGQRERCSDL